VRYREADLSRVTTIPVAGRQNKVESKLLASPPGPNRSFTAFLDSLPDVLAARDLRLVIEAVAAAKRGGRGVILLLGGHVIKVGLGPLVNAWLARGIVTHVALNGAAAIHDFELAAFGGTSEDVESGLADGSFGMAEETGAEMNAAIARAAAADRARKSRFSFPRWSMTSPSRFTQPSAPRSSISIHRAMAPRSELRATVTFAAWQGRFQTWTRGESCSTGAARYSCPRSFSRR